MSATDTNPTGNGSTNEQIFPYGAPPPPQQPAESVSYSLFSWGATSGEDGEVPTYQSDEKSETVMRWSLCSLLLSCLIFLLVGVAWIPVSWRELAHFSLRCFVFVALFKPKHPLPPFFCADVINF